MTTLTRILLNPARREGRKLLNNPQALHAAVCASFPPDINTDSGRILWRIDHRNHEHILYMVGPEAPTGTHLVEDAGWMTRPQETADYDRFLSRLMVGQQWQFELLANPTYNEYREGKRGAVKAHVTAEHQLNWLMNRSENHGFSLLAGDEPTARVIGREVLSFNKNDKGTQHKRHRVRIHTARFEGVLQVTDVEALAYSLRNGIGRARGYGCGLLTLAPVKSS